MTWYTTKVADLKDLVAELDRLEVDLHTIFKVISKDGVLIIISHTTP